MPRKKITIGHSSKNGQKAVFDRLFYGEITREDQAKILSVKQETDIEFHSPRDRDFEKTAYTMAAILSGDSSELDLTHRQERKEFAANLEKLYLLMDHYGIGRADPVNFALLSIELARELFPPIKSKGRKQKWSKQIEATLVVDMENIIAKNKSISNAANILAKNSIWSYFIESKSDNIDAESLAKTIRTEYSKIRKKPHIKESRKPLDQMTQSEFEAHRKMVVRKPPTF